MTNIITKAICDRDFDIPDWMYDHINDDVIRSLLPTVYHQYGNKSNLISLYKDSTKRKFFDTVKKRIRIDHSLAKLIYFMGDGVFTGLLFDKKAWKYMRKEIKTRPKKFIYILTEYLLSSDDMKEQAKLVIDAIGYKKDYIIENVYDRLEMYSDSIRRERIYRLINILDVPNDYSLVQKCLSMGIPVFFNNGDTVDLHCYLSTIVKTKWNYTISKDIVTIQVTDEDDEIIDMMIYIYSHLNRSIIVMAKQMMTDPSLFERYFNGVDGLLDKLSNLDKLPDQVVDKTIVYGIKDFKDLIILFGHNHYGISLSVQSKFIMSGGDIKTFFNEDGTLLPEASIIKTADQLDYIIKNTSIEDLRFIIYSSADFVKNILYGSIVSQSSYVKILKALFEYPINENLWKVLNKPNYEDGNIDFREIIIHRIIALMTLDNVFISVPEAMLYIEPSALFVIRNLTPKNIPFIPVTKLIPYLPSIINSKNGYVKLNRYCRGAYVSLSQVITTDIIINTISKYEKYGYLGDIEGVDMDKILASIS